MTQRALVWMQQDTEKQAKATRAMHELLHGVVLILNDVFTDLLTVEGTSSSSVTADVTLPSMKDAPHWSELSIERVDALVSEWESALLTWRSAGDARVREAAERVALYREDSSAKTQALLDSHAQERGASWYLTTCNSSCVVGQATTLSLTTACASDAPGQGRRPDSSPRAAAEYVLLTRRCLDSRALDQPPLCVCVAVASR